MQMLSLGRVFAGDEELGKKDDDHRRAKDGLLPSVWPVRKTAPRARGRSVLYGLLACIIIYLFVHNIPTDLGPVSQRPDSRVPTQGSLRPLRLEQPTAKSPKPERLPPAEKYYYDGPITFYRLATSLHAVVRLIGHAGVNKNVLFAASNLKSAAEMIPIACEMARWERNNVHFAVLGRDDLAMEEIMLVNGVTGECKIYWHDARPDFSPVSSQSRMETSVGAAMGHIQTFVRPQVILIDDPNREDAFFTKAMRSKALEIGKSVIELPTNAATNLMWITRLDSGSLAAWHTTYVDLLIHAPRGSSGSLIRLLKTIEAADYFGSRRPHLRLELPADIDPPTWNFVQNLVWPPIDWSGAPHVSQVSLRHSTLRRDPTAEEAAVHLVESFYPARPRDSHVLLLSPQAELSPLYYHYLMYNILEYRHSSQGQSSQEPNSLMGLSLELPSHHLNDTDFFTPPLLERPYLQGVPKQPGRATHFLWQSPNSNAALYFGDKWIEFHSFLAARLSALNYKTPRQKKIINEKYPSWMEYLQELMRARGYSLLYPNFSSTSESIATIHNELYQPPEEFSQPHTSSNPHQSLPTMDPNEPFTADASAQPARPSIHTEAPLLSTNLLSILPQSGDLSDLSSIPLLSYEGNELSHTSSNVLSNAFAGEFRREIGGCVGNDDIWIYQMSANDLFCNLNLDQYSDISEEEKNDYESKDTKQVVKEAPKTPESTEQQDDSDFSQSEFAAHMNRQAAKPIEDAPAKVSLEDPEDTQKEFSDHLARQGAKKPDPVKPKSPTKDAAKPAAEGTSIESHDTVVMQTDHVSGKKTDDTPAMPADHVAGKKGEHAVVKISDKATEKPSDGASIKMSAEEKVTKSDSVKNIKATVLNADGGADTGKDAETSERKPGW